ncbi:MAG TPA: histidine kinase N-terminal 7TM domain-containing protein, partial [Anaerolineaceae bacterium]|nr:histidine kinase N-terminal 7TM domain-containing protein [Anaerolineaceae bacterium]
MYSSAQQFSLLGPIQTISDILTAGVAVTAFSLLLYALTFNLRDRVARTFAFIMICVVIVFAGEAFASTAPRAMWLDFWLRVQWVGIALLPAAYFQFSDALLETTGRPSRGRRRLAIRLGYLISIGFIATLPFGGLVGSLVPENEPAPYLEATAITDLFVLYYLGMMLLALINFLRAYLRTVTSASQRRMVYLVVGAVAPALGSFPFLLFTTGFSARHPVLFWSVVAGSNFLVNGLLVVMAYGVAFFGVAWPDRVVKSRLFRWILRGPVSASLTLALTTIIRRTSGLESALVPIIMVATILLTQHLITLLAPTAERWLFYGQDKEDLQVVKSLEDRLLTRNDLQQYLEMILAALCDRLQAPGAFLASIQPEGLEQVVRVGRVRFDDSAVSQEITRLVQQNGSLPDLFQWGETYLMPLFDSGEEPEEGEGRANLLGILGVSGINVAEVDEEEAEVIRVLVSRASEALLDYRLQEEVFASLENLNTKVETIQRLRAAGQYNRARVFEADGLPVNGDVTQWVKDALSHYWGGPKL